MVLGVPILKHFRVANKLIVNLRTKTIKSNYVALRVLKFSLLMTY